MVDTRTGEKKNADRQNSENNTKQVLLLSMISSILFIYRLELVCIVLAGIITILVPAALLQAQTP